MPRLPINNTQLVYNSGIITGYYFKQIRDITTEKDLAKHVMDMDNWVTETFSWINWPAFQRCRNSIDQQDNKIVKLTHDILPTNYQVHKHDKSVLEKSTLCKSRIETRDHLLQCTSDAAQSWRKSFLAHFTKHL
eukprot:4538338-Ditylum_brightwellii.AAC.1